MEPQNTPDQLGGQAPVPAQPQNNTPQPYPPSPAPVPVTQQTAVPDAHNPPAAPVAVQQIYPTPPVNPVGAQPAAAVAADDEQKDYVVAFLLSWLLGGMGADRFYLGYTKSGIVKLITLGGLGIWVVIDVWRLAFGKLGDKSGLPLKGYDKNKSWTKALAIIHVLVLVLIVPLIIFSTILTAKNGVQQKARDTKRKVDINALQAAVETYKLDNGSYPSLSQMNSSIFRQTSLKQLDSQAFKDPQGTTDQLSGLPSINQYSYETAPSGCAGTTQDPCLSYVLTAELDSGGTYSQQSQ